MTRFLVQLADKTSFYLSQEEGIQAMKAWSLGENIVCRKGAFAHYLISGIRVLRQGDELYNDCIEQEELEERQDQERSLIREGKLKLLPAKTKDEYEELEHKKQNYRQGKFDDKTMTRLSDFLPAYRENQ